MQKITPFLWFDNNAEEAMNFYTSIFPDSKIGKISRYPEAGPGPAGSVMTAEFTLQGQKFLALNGGPRFKFTEAVSFLVSCENQAELDHYWDKLLEGGGETQACGWLKDRFGLSWQICPSKIGEWLSSPDKEKRERVMNAVWSMVKLDIPTLERAYEREEVNAG
jgi:predicted 3-demethylubiquinone-9 3-methyltransferase (glyoxalase superfamily)